MGKASTKIQLIIETVTRDKGTSKLVASIQKVNKALNAKPKGIEAMQKSFRNAEKYAVAFKKVLSDPKADTALQRLNKAQQNYNEKLQRARDLVEKGTANVTTGKNLKKAKADLDAAAEAYGKYGLRAEEAGKKAADFIQKLAGAGIDISKYSETLEGAVAGNKALGAILPTISTVITGVASAVKLASKKFQQWNGQIKEFGQGIARVWGGLKNSIGGFRLMAQGVLTVARSMTFFVAVPITLFLKEATKSALNLQDALIRVAKVTGTMFDDPAAMTEYRGELAEMAVVSASSMEQLAKFSEQLGQMGLREKAPMLEMVAIMDVVAAATDIAADNIAIDLGSIANAFGKSLGFSGEALQETIIFIDRAAEVINALENAAGVTASQVVKMLKDVGATFSGLSSGFNEAGKAITMNIGQIAGWATAAKEFGLSADEVGTALRNLPSYMYDNAEAIDRLNLSTERFSSTQEFINGLHTDFYGTVDSLISMLATDVDAMSAVSAATELLGRRSGKLLTNLVKARQAIDDSGEAYDELGNKMSRYDMIMETANEAWLHGGSLMDEYNKYLASTTVKTKMLKNGLENLSMVVADDIIPSLNKLVDIAAAGALAFSQMYKTLDIGTKKVMAKVLAFAALYGPVSWFLSQTVFGIGMVVNGLMRLGSFIMPLIGLFKTLVVGLISLNPVLILIGGTLYGLFSTYTGGMQKIADGITTFFKNLNDNAGKWSKTLMDTFADGIITGSKAVFQAIGMLAKGIASFLEAHSPPEQGPLSGIDMWGAKLMNTYLKGFAQADFGILSDVADKIEGILGSIHFTPSGDDDDKERRNVLKGLIKFREQFTKLLKDNRKGVKITDKYLDNLLKGFGDSKDEVKKLIVAYLELEKVQRRLADIAEEREKIDERYETQVEVIRLSGATAEEMVESIASAAYERDNSNKALTIEERLLEKREEMMQLQLDTQQELLDALQEQSDLWKELLTLQSEAGGAGDESTLRGGLDIDTQAMEEAASKLQEVQLRFIELNVQAQKFKLVVLTLVEYVKRMWAILLGADPSIMDDVVIDATVDFDGKAFSKQMLDSYADIFGEIEDEADAKEFINTYSDNIVDQITELVPKAEAMVAVREWIADTFPDMGDEAASSLAQTMSDSFSEITGVETKQIISDKLREMLPEGEELPTIDIPIIDTHVTSYFDTYKADFQTQADDMAISIGLFSDKISTAFSDFWAAMGAGFTGTGMDSDPLSDMFGPLEGPNLEPTTIEQIGEAIGAFAKLLVDNLPSILDSLGQIAESLTKLFIVLFGGDPEAGGADNLAKVTTLLDTLATTLEDYTLDISPAEIKIDLAKTVVKVAGAAILAKVIGSAIVGAISAWLVGGGIAALWATISTSIYVWATTAGPAIGTAIATFFAGLTIPAWGLIAAIGALIWAVVEHGAAAWDSAKMLGAIIAASFNKEDTSEWWGYVTDWWHNLWNKNGDLEDGDVSGAFKMASPVAPDRGPIEEFISWAEDTAGPAITTFFETTIPNAFTTFVETISGFGTELFNKGKDAAKNLAKGFFDIIQKLINAYNIKIADTWLGGMLNIPTINVTMPNVDQWQGGGRPVAGALGVIGEAGRELFSAPVAGKITSHSLTEKMMRDVGAGAGPGGDWVINIHNPVVRDEGDIDKLVDTLMYRLAEEVG